MSSSLLYPPRFPNVSGGIGGSPSISPSREKAQAPEIANANIPSESFNQILGNQLQQPVTEPLKFSAHATARVQSRNLNISPEQMRKLNDAVDKAAAKGLDDTLILTKDAAFIVSVSNRTVVTAMDRAALDGNVFTNIDGAVIAN